MNRFKVDFIFKLIKKIKYYLVDNLYINYSKYTKMKNINFRS